MANIFFTESKGYLNHSLIYKLKTAGHKVTVLVKTQEEAKLVESTGAALFWGDASDTAGFTGALSASDIVIRTPDLFDLKFAHSESTVVEGIIAALKGTNKTFIYTSSAWVLGETGNVLADERTPLAPPALVAPLAQIEGLVLDSAKQGIRSIVIRPSIIYGFEGDYIDEVITASRRERFVGFLTEGRSVGTYVHIEELVDLYLRAIDKAPAGALYQAGSSDFVSQLELAEAISKAFSIKEKRSLSIEQSRAKFGVLAEVYGLSQKIDFARAKADLKWEPRKPGVLTYVVEREKALAALAK